MTKKLTKYQEEQKKQYEDARARYREGVYEEILDVMDNSFLYDQKIHLMCELATIKQQVVELTERFDLRDGCGYETWDGFNENEYSIDHTADLIVMFQKTFDKVIDSVRDATFGAHPEPLRSAQQSRSLRDLLRSQRDQNQTDCDPDQDPDKLN